MSFTEWLGCIGFAIPFWGSLFAFKTGFMHEYVLNCASWAGFDPLYLGNALVQGAFDTAPTITLVGAILVAIAVVRIREGLPRTMILLETLMLVMVAIHTGWALACGHATLFLVIAWASAAMQLIDVARNFKEAFDY